MQGTLPSPSAPTKPNEADPFNRGRLSFWRVEYLGSADIAGAPPVDVDYDVSDDYDGPPLVQRYDTGIYLTFWKSCRFRIDPANRCVTVFAVDPGVTDADLSHLLNDQVAPRMIAEAGGTVLHGSVVEMDGVLAVFLGETGAGKSTLGASLERAGYRLLGDDAVIVERAENGGYCGEPVYPSLRLFPESIAALIGDDVETAVMAGYSDKRFVRLGQLPGRAGTSLPIAALFFLGGGEIAARDVELTPLASAHACIGLVEQSFAMDPSEPDCVERRLAAFSQLALRVPAFKLCYPHNYQRLPEVHNAIRNAMNSLEITKNIGAAA